MSFTPEQAEDVTIAIRQIAAHLAYLCKYVEWLQKRELGN